LGPKKENLIKYFLKTISSEEPAKGGAIMGPKKENLIKYFLKTISSEEPAILML
jgi:hypothetical protein